MTLTPTTDAYVRSDTPTTSYSSSTPMWVKGTNPEAITYLVFDVPAPAGTVTDVTLTLSAVATVIGDWGVYACPAVDGTVTYEGRPALGDLLLDVPGGVAAGPNTLTLPPSAIPADGGQVCLALVKAGGGVFKFASAESVTPPTLDVTVLPTSGPQPWPHPELPTLAPTGAAASLYVDSATGLDTNDGTQDAPLQTLQRAVDLAVVDNTEILVRGTHAAVTFGGKGSKHFWLRPDGTDRFVVDGGDVALFGIDTRGAAGGVTIEGAEVRNFRNQGVIAGNNTVLRYSVVHDIFADWTTRAPLSNEDSNQSAVKVTGTDVLVTDNLIYNVGQHGEARGILLLAAKRAKVLRNHVVGARKEGIRDAYGGLDNEIAYNVFAVCWAGISIETTMGTWCHHNVVQDCTFGIFTKHTVAQQTAPNTPFPDGTVRPQPADVDPTLYRWVVIEDNTILRCLETAAWLHDNQPWGDCVCFRRNTIAGAHRRYILTTQDPAIRGPNFILDGNIYVMDMPDWDEPQLVYKGDGLQGTNQAWQAATLAELQAEHPDLEVNGRVVAYADVMIVDDLPVAWARPPAMLATVSHRPTQAIRLIDGLPSMPWEAGLDAAGNPVDAGAEIVLDYGEPVTFTHLLMHPWAHGSNQCPRSLGLEYSDDDQTYTVWGTIVFNDSEGSGYWWNLHEAITARFVRATNIVDFAGAASPPKTTRNGMQIGELGVGCLQLAGLPATQVVG